MSDAKNFNNQSHDDASPQSPPQPPPLLQSQPSFNLASTDQETEASSTPTLTQTTITSTTTNQSKRQQQTNQRTTSKDAFQECQNLVRENATKKSGLTLETNVKEKSRANRRNPTQLTEFCQLCRCKNAGIPGL